jgi:hypothetical protein
LYIEFPVWAPALTLLDNVREVHTTENHLYLCWICGFHACDSDEYYILWYKAM